MARRDRRRATTGALAVSLLVHLALFIVLAREVAPGFRTPARTESDFQVQLVTEPPQAAAPGSPAPRAASRRVVRQAPAAPSAPVVQRPRRSLASPPRPVEPARPVPPRVPPAAHPALRPSGVGAGARTGSGATPAPSPGPGAWAVQGDDGQDGVRTFLRATVGCSHEDYVNLNANERAACDRRVAIAARVGAQKVDGLSAEARAAFDAAVHAQEEARSSRMQEPFVPCKGAGSNLDRGCINMKSKHPEDEAN